MIIWSSSEAADGNIVAGLPVPDERAGAQETSRRASKLLGTDALLSPEMVGQAIIDSLFFFAMALVARRVPNHHSLLSRAGMCRSLTGDACSHSSAFTATDRPTQPEQQVHQQTQPVFTFPFFSSLLSP